MMIQYYIHKKKLELWTNSDKSEYAIYLKSNSAKNSRNKDINDKLLAATSYNRNIKYTELVDEADYLEDLEYDWKYTLEQWIDNNKDLITITELLSSSPPIHSHFENSLTQQQQVQEEERDNTDNNGEEEEKSASNTITIHRNFRMYRVRTRKKKKTNLKICHFCKLEYPTNKQRVEHEQAWHIHLIPK
jgi:predicted metal-dependent peptidase